MGYCIVILLIIAADIGSKAVVNRIMKVGEKREIVKNRFYLWHIKNKGVAYNRFEKHPMMILGISAAALTAFAFRLYQTEKAGQKTGASFFLSLLLGGALGNFFERIKNKNVTDFLYIKIKKAPIFNIADTFVVFGGIFFILSSIFSKEK